MTENDKLDFTQIKHFLSEISIWKQKPFLRMEKYFQKSNQRAYPKYVDKNIRKAYI